MRTVSQQPCGRSPVRTAADACAASVLSVASGAFSWQIASACSCTPLSISPTSSLSIELSGIVGGLPSGLAGMPRCSRLNCGSTLIRPGSEPYEAEVTCRAWKDASTAAVISSWAEATCCSSGFVEVGVGRRTGSELVRAGPRPCFARPCWVGLKAMLPRRSGRGCLGVLSDFETPSEFTCLHIGDEPREEKGFEKGEDGVDKGAALLATMADGPSGGQSRAIVARPSHRRPSTLRRQSSNAMEALE